MNGLWYYVIAFLLIWTIAAFYKLYHPDSKNLEMSFPILLMLKTDRFKGFIDKVAKKAPRFWKWYMNVGIVICFIAMALMLVLLIQSLGTVLKTPSVSILIPGVEVPGSPIFIPFISGFIALILLIIVHEFSHGILARVEGIDIKSMGLLLFVILPGAFVEPDEEEVEKASRLSKLRIYGAGARANIVLALIALIIFAAIANFAVPAVYDQSGVEITSVVNNGPAYGNLKEGMVVTSINDHKVTNATSYSSAVYSLKPNTTAHITTDKGTYTFRLGENPNNKTLGYMGIRSQEHLVLKENIRNTYGNILPWGLLSLEDLFKWIYLINLSVGLFNLLPMKPLDGGLMLEELLSYKLSGENVKLITDYFTYFTLIVIVFSLVAGIFISL